MRKSRYSSQRASLKGGLKFIPFLLMPFAVLFSETWLQTQMLVNGYEQNEISEETGTILERIDELEDRKAKLHRMTRIEQSAPRLGLIEPAPHQLHRIEADDALDSITGINQYEIARGRGWREEPQVP